MPPLKSVQNLRELCLQTVFRHFAQLERQAEILPPILINDLFERSNEILNYNFVENVSRIFPAKLFIHPATTTLTRLDSFYISRDNAEKIRSTCKRLRKVRFSRQFDFMEIILNNPRLVDLDLPGSTVTNKNLAVIAKNCPQLMKLNLQNCSSITDEGLQYLPPNITHLSLNSFFITEKGCITALNSLQSLKELDYFRWNEILRLLSRENCNTKYSIEKVNVQLYRIPNFDFCKVLNDFFPKLQTININMSHVRILNIGILMKSKINHKITYLSLYEFYLDIKIIDYLCPMLEELHIVFRKTRGNQQLEITEHQNAQHISFKHLLKLQLNVIYLELPRKDFFIMMENFYQLKFLRILFCNESLHKMFIDLIKMKLLHHLEHLSLSYCDFITIESMTTILESLSSLQKLGISSCEQISDNELVTLKEFIKNHNWDVTLTNW